MRIQQAIAIAKADETHLIRFIGRRDRFLDGLDWDALPEQMAREAAMMDELLATELAEAACYVIWLEECLSFGVEDVIGAHHLQPASVIRTVASLA